MSKHFVQFLFEFLDKLPIPIEKVEKLSDRFQYVFQKFKMCFSGNSQYFHILGRHFLRPRDHSLINIEVSFYSIPGNKSKDFLQFW